MTAKAEYTPNGYVCNKCGSRMDAIITPPLSILGKIKLVCNNCNKHMTKTWQEKFDKDWELYSKGINLTIKTFDKNNNCEICSLCGTNPNELGKNVKQFISNIIDQTRKETIREVEDIVNKIIIKDYSKKWGDNVVDFAQDIVNRTILLIKEQLNKLKK